MAGLSSRFFKAGYKKPKYMLKAHDVFLFDYAVSSFEKYFEKELFLFVIRDVYGTKNFVEKRAKSLGIKNYLIHEVSYETKGQAETVALGLSSVGFDYDDSLTIFNIDTFRPEFHYPSSVDIEDGFLEVFQGEGDNWSFVKPIENTRKVSMTTEKNPVSNLCCTGLYHFAKVSLFMKAYREYLKRPEETWEKGELYVAPLYNELISSGYNINYNLIPRDSVIFCGTPEEYDDFIKCKL